VEVVVWGEVTGVVVDGVDVVGVVAGTSSTLFALFFPLEYRRSNRRGRM